MKKDIEWLKEEAMNLYPNHSEMYEHPDYLTVEKVDLINNFIDLIDQLDEPEKPVIPEFVADWIDAYNLHGNNPLREYRDLVNDFDEGWTDEEDAAVYHWVNKSPYAFIDALRYGYEVEKEKKYYVAFEDTNLLYVTRVEVYGENEKLNYSSESSTENAIKFIDKEKASSLAYFLGAIVVEVTQ